MAKKREKPAGPEMAPEPVETIRIDEPIAPVPTDDGWVPDLWANFDVSSPGQSPHTVRLRSLADDTPYPVRFELPMAVLFAIVDPNHPNADPDAAVLFGLIDRKSHKPTLIGDLVLSGTDQTSLRHKMRWVR